MAVQLPNVQQPFVEPNTGLVNRTWYLALLNLNNSVLNQVVTSVTLVGTNGITASGGTITSSGQFTVSLAPTGVVSGTYGNSTNAPVLAINATGQITSASTVALAGLSGTVTSIEVVGFNGITVSSALIQTSGTVNLRIGNLTCTNVQTTGTVTAADVVASATIVGANLRATATVTAANAIVTANVTAANIALSGVLRLGNAFTAGITGAAGWVTVMDSTGTTYKLLAQL